MMTWNRSSGGLVVAWALTVTALGGCSALTDTDKYEFIEGGAQDAQSEAGGGDAGPEAGADAGTCTTDDDCDDGQACNGTETCSEAGVCEAGDPVDCDDGVACTEDTCMEPDGECTHSPDDSACGQDEVCHATEGCRPMSLCETDEDCDDGAACNGTERCDPSDPEADPTTGCVPGTPVDCDDGVACTTDVCMDPDGTCKHIGSDGDGYLPMDCMDGTDCDDGAMSIHPGADEVCDGVDNNCSGMADDGPNMECVMGSGSTSCTTSCGTPGTHSCTADCTYGPCTGDEVCNGCDDDGDGTPDNGFACALGTGMTCTTSCGTQGTKDCLDDCSGYADTCTADERCNDCNDDGDNAIDEGFECRIDDTESCTVGACSGTKTCRDDCTFGSCDLGDPPSNDACGGSITTIASSGSFGFETCAAADDYTATCAGGATGPDVLFELSLSAHSVVDLHITNNDYDTAMVLRSGTSCPGSEVACDDNGGDAQDASRITTQLSPGTYWIVLDGPTWDNQGSGTLDVDITPFPDECSQARNLELSNTRTTVTGSTEAPATDSDGSCTSSNDLWYKFTIQQRRLVFINTHGSTYDTLIGMRDGSCSSATDYCSDDWCGTTKSAIVRVLSPGTYYIVVDGYSSSSEGDFTLKLEQLSAPNGTSTELVSAGSSMHTGTTSGTGVVAGGCHNDSGAPEDLYYWTQCPGADGGSFSASTCGSSYDTGMYVRSGNETTNLDCSDDAPVCADILHAAVSSTIPSGFGLFGVYVDGYGTSSGSYTANITRP